MATITGQYLNIKSHWGNILKSMFSKSIEPIEANLTEMSIGWLSSKNLFIFFVCVGNWKFKMTTNTGQSISI